MHRWLLVLVLLALGPSMALADTIGFSSERIVGDGNGAARLAFDGDLGTSWIEGVPGLGRDEWIEVKFNRPRAIKTVTIFGGNFQSTQTLPNYAHIEKAAIEWDGEKGGKVDIFPSQDYEALTVAIDDTVTRVRLTLGANYDGVRYSETHVAEMAFDWGLTEPKLVANRDAWLKRSSSKKAMAAYEAQRNEVVEAAKSGALSAEQALVLESAAARGHSVHRKWAEKTLAPGYMLSYLPTDLAAVDLLGQLKRVESIAIVEQSAARTQNVDTRATLSYLGKWLRAYELFQSSKASGIAYWGSNGDQIGQLQGRGEALSLSLDYEGRLFVADMGNGRIQRFSSNGRVNAHSGENRGVATTFLGRDVDPYVAGNLPTKQGADMISPLAVLVVYEGREQRLVVLDHTMTLSLYDLDLKTKLAQWKVETSEEYLPGYGLQNPVLVQAKPGQVTVFIGLNGMVYNLDGSLEKQFVLDGAPTSATFLKRRYLLAFDGGKVVSYTADGFRDQLFFEVPSGDRSQSLDVTVDDSDRLIVHTDGGHAYQLDKRGRLLQVQKTFKEPAGPCRIASQGGILFVTHNDGIRRFELLEP